MTYRIEFYRGDTLYHSKDWELGLEAAKQHASVMAKPYEATSARVVDAKRRVVFDYPLPGTQLTL